MIAVDEVAELRPAEHEAREDASGPGATGGPKLTPMMRQWRAVKAQHPGAILLFRMGDFFETFYEDAVDCSRILDLTLTRRSKDKDAAPMAGVPHHAVDAYISKLIEAGRTVVLVDQVEDPKLAKGLVRREVTEVLSPGTFLDPHAPPRVSTYLVALHLVTSRKRDPGFGLAALDLSTGEFRATSGGGDELLFEELARLGMREIVIDEALAQDARVERLRRDLPRVALTPVASALFERRAVEASLERTFGAEEARGLTTVLSEEGLTAAGVALQYVETLKPRRTEQGGERPQLLHISELKPYVPGHALVLDQDARLHLELFRTSSDGQRKGSLLGAIDEAVTAMGGRLLGRWLAYPLRELETIAARQDAIAAFVARPSALDAVREALEGIADLERLVARVVMGKANPRDLATLAQVLSRAPVALDAARVLGTAPRDESEPSLVPLETHTPESTILAALGAVDPCAEVRDRILGALVEDPPIDLDSGDVFRAGFDPELDQLTRLARDGKGMIAALEAKEKEATGISSLKVRYNRVFGYYIEITKANLKSVPSRYIRKQTTANGERFFTEELRELESEVLSADEKRGVRARLLFTELVEGIGREAKRLRKLAEAIAELDVLAALARVAERRSWVRPVVDGSGVVEIADGRHPVLEVLANELGERFVPNDLALSREQSLMIITGPNMAGKSTIMRQTALIAVLAHMGAFVPAKAARIGLLDRIFTRVGASDDLSKGRSTFMVEMNETARILRSATRDSLIVLDEIGRGTSTFDGLSIAWSVAEHLHDVVGAKTLFATHYHELTDLCRDKPRAVNHHVAVKEWNDEIVFLRKLLPGPTNRSYGVQVARLAGLPKAVVDRAREVLASLEGQELSAGPRAPAPRAPKPRGPSGDEHQLFLFARPEPQAPKPTEDPGVAAILGALESLSIDDLTPRQALDRLAELKALVPIPRRS